MESRVYLRGNISNEQLVVLILVLMESRVYIIPP